MSCNGRCCVAFTTSKPPQEMVGGHPLIGGVKDGDLLRFMLRPITPEEAVERVNRLYDEHYEPEPNVQRYRCIYFNEETRLCSIYEHRPDMCRDYPYPTHEGDGVCCHGCDCKGSPLVWTGDSA